MLFHQIWVDKTNMPKKWSRKNNQENHHLQKGYKQATYKKKNSNTITGMKKHKYPLFTFTPNYEVSIQYIGNFCHF